MTDPHATSETYSIPNLDCPDELALIRKGLGRVEGILDLSADYLNRSLQVQFDRNLVDGETITDQLRRIGFPVAAGDAETGDAGRQTTAGPLRATTIAGGVFLGAAVVVWAVAGPSVFVAALAVVSTVLSGWPVAGSAWKAIRLGRLDMNALMTIAATGAVATGQTFEAATAMFLFGVAIWLESYSVGRARRAVKTLLELVPPVAHRRSGPADVVDVDPAELVAGDRVLVRPGERVPIDGRVTAGSSAVNEAAITGESMPVEKSEGEPVFAGSLNGEGSLELIASRPAGESTLAHIARLVRQAQVVHSPTERFVDRFARYYTPTVIGLAVCLALGPPLVGAWFDVGWAAAVPPSQWLFRGLVLLVIACPCALVISTPVTIVCGLHRATRHGILIKGGQYLEAAAKIDYVAIDKTGTLTTGRPHVAAVKSAPGFSEADVLRAAAALESHSEHPLARAIVAAARDRGVRWKPAADFAAIRGFGAQAAFDGDTWYVASAGYFQKEQFGGGQIPEDWLDPHGTATVALVGTRRRLLGAIHLADQPRPDAADAVAELKQLGVAGVAMLTGDRRAVADHIAQAVGIDDVYAELLPEDKVARVEQMAGRRRGLAMVGDGVNDAAALAAAHVGIAMGSQSSDTALETADVVFMAPRLTRLGRLIRLARRTRRVLRQNIFLALAIKLGVLVLAAAGSVTMWMAVAADVGTSMLVIFNGMRLLSPGDDASSTRR